MKHSWREKPKTKALKLCRNKEYGPSEKVRSKSGLRARKRELLEQKIGSKEEEYEG